MQIETHNLSSWCVLFSVHSVTIKDPSANIDNVPHTKHMPRTLL